MRLCASITAMLVGSPTMMSARGAAGRWPKPRDQRADPSAADLLVIGDDDMHRLLSAGRDMKSGTEAEHAS